MPSKKATCLFIILLILLFLTGYSFSKQIREKRGQTAPVSQSYTGTAVETSVPTFSSHSDASPTFYSERSGDRAAINVFDYTDEDISSQGITEYGDGAVYYGVSRYKPEDFLPLTPATLDDTAYMRLSFSNAEHHAVYSDLVEHILDDGDSAMVDINISIWSPEYNDLEIGIYNQTTAENYCVKLSDGQVRDCTITVRDLSAGTYIIYVRNLGTQTLDTGYMLYNLS